MMKYLLIVATFCLFFTNMIYSSECDEGEYRNELRLDSGRKYIRYEFGFSNIIDIYITDGDSICDVAILDGKGNCVSTTCRKSPILKWAFDDMTNEITKASVKSDNKYKPYYYKLSIVNDSSQTILSSSTLLFDYRDDVKKKIEELKTLIIRLWSSNVVSLLFHE